MFEEIEAAGLTPDLTAHCALVDALLNKWAQQRADGSDELLLQAQVGVCGCF